MFFLEQGQKGSVVWYESIENKLSFIKMAYVFFLYILCVAKRKAAILLKIYF